MKHRSSLRTIVFRFALLPVWMTVLVSGIAPAAAAPVAAPHAAPSTCGSGDPLTVVGTCTVTIDVHDFASGLALADFNFIINVDNAKLPSDTLALNSESFSPIVRTGGNDRTTFTLPDGRYLVSARSLNHKLWGAYFTLPDDAANDSTLTVRVDLTEQSEAHPLPLGRLTTFVFEDNNWTNGAPDAEDVARDTGMVGFRVEITEETESPVTVDYNNDPLCGDGVCLTDADGFNTIENLGPATYNLHVTPPDACNPDPNAADRLTSGPGHWYQTTTIDGGLSLVAPVEEGSDGSGAPGEQLWEPIVGVGGAEGNRTGYFFGFVCAPMDWSGDYSGGTNEIVGQARNWVEWAPYTFGTVNEPVPNPFIALTDAATDRTVFVGLGDGAGNFDIQNVPDGTYVMSIWDEQLSYIMRFKPITVAGGVTADANEVGDDGEAGVGVSRWFGWLDGYVYKDVDGNGQYDPGVDTTLGNTDVDQRWRDGSIKEATFTDPDGYYVYPTAEGGGLGRWIVGEQGFARFSAFPGASVHDEHTGAVIPSCVTDGPAPAANCIPNAEGGGLLVNQLVLEGHRATVDWGKRDYPPGTPGLIVGITYFATTRNEFNAALQAHEDYEPAVPDVIVLLETPGPNGIPNDFDDVVVNSYVTDHWVQPSAAEDPLDGTTFTQSCDPIRDFAGNTISDATGGLFNPMIGPECLEVPLTGIQTKEGKFDGGYAFGSYCPDGYDLAADDGSCLGANPEQVPLVAGDYLVHAIMPKDPTDTRLCNDPTLPAGFKSISDPIGSIPGGGQGCLYRIVREEDVNVDLGNQFAPQIPPPPCVGDDHVFDQSTMVTRSPYYTGNPFFNGITSAPLCDKKLVVLQNGQNANADFNMMTNFRTDPNGDGSSSATGDVAEPGRFVGQSFNDIYFENNPMSPWYGEPRPIGGIPVGIYARVDVAQGGGPGAPYFITGREIGRDGSLAPTVTYDANKWRLITMVTTSRDGSFEALLPSTETLNCPIPQGPCPGMYMITVDDPGFFDSVPGGPGDHSNPNFNPNLLTATTPASSWPGLTNPTLDLPLDPISGTACDFSVQRPDLDEIASTTPELLQVSRPYVNESDSSTARQITIFGDFIGPAGPTDATGGHVNLTDFRTGAVTTLTQANGGIVSWTPGSGATPDTIVIQVPDVGGGFPPGPKQLTIVGADDPTNSDDGKSSVNGITLHVLSSATISGTRTDNGTTRTSTFVTDAAVVAGDLGRFVTASPATGFTGGRTIVSPVTPGVGFTINSPATATGTRNLTITRADLVGVTTGSNVATDPSAVAADLGRSVTFFLAGNGLGGTRTITAVTPGVNFTFSGTPKSSGGSSTRLATITKTDLGAFITTGTLVIDSSITAADVGKPVSGTGIPAGTTIVSVTPGVSFVMSNPATATSYPGTVALTIGTPVAVTPYNPPLVLVAAPPPAGGDPHALQNAIDSAAAGSLLVLSPGTYNENILLWKPLKLQGLGPGGVIGAHELGQRAPEDPRFHVKGSVIDGRFFQQYATYFHGTDGAGGIVGAHGPYAVDPIFLTILSGADITVVAQTTGAYGSSPTDMLASTTARIDGLGLQHGHGEGAGGIQLQAYINNMQITNNILENNGGLFAGGIGVGQPYAHANNNHNVSMNYNRVLGNGGLVRSGGTGIFYGADNYEVGNSIYCGNYSVEYGAGVSHWGFSPGGSIHDNQIYYNESVDSAGGIGIQNEVPGPTDPRSSDPNFLGDGSGSVDIDSNLLQQNLSGDDGGGIFIQDSLTAPINIRNNMIVDNGAADIGGAIMLDDAANVRIINNTVANNITTASSENSCITPTFPATTCAHSAGLAAEANDPRFQAMLPPGAPDFSNPTALFNNIFWNNSAFTLTQFGPGATLVPVDPPDVPQVFPEFEISGTSDPAATFTPRFSDLTNENVLVNSTEPFNTVTANQGNTSGDPLFEAGFPLTCCNELQITGSRLDPQFVSITLTGGDPPVGLTGDYHLAEPAVPAAATASVVIDRGVRCAFTPANPVPLNANGPCTNTPPAGGRGTEAPFVDYDEQIRPQLRTIRLLTPWDLGADELPSVPAPFANILDNFNRANAATLGPNWTSNTTTGYGIFGNQAQVLDSGYALWKPGPSPTTGVFNTRQFAFMYITKVVGSATEYDLLLKANNLTGTSAAVGPNSSLIKVQYNPSTSTVIISTYCGTAVPGCGAQGWQIRGTFPGIAFAPGDQFAAQTRDGDAGGGVVEFFQNGVEIGSVETTTPGPAWPTALNTGGGRIGVWFVRSPNFATPNDARFDNFGGGSLP